MVNVTPGYRRALNISVTLFWLVMTGMLIQRHYGFFHLAGPPPRSSLTLPDIEEQWMGVYQYGEKVGYLSRKISPVPAGYSMDETFRIKTRIMGVEKDLMTSLNADLDHSLRLVSFAAKITADLDIDVSGKVRGNDLTLIINSSGAKTIKNIHLRKEPTLEGPAFAAMLRDLRPGERITVPVFDPALMDIKNLGLTIEAKEKILSLGKWREAYRVNGNMDGIDFNVWMTENGEILKEETPMGLLFLKEAKGDALKIGHPSLDLISQASVPLNMKLPPNISYLKIRISGIDFNGLEIDGGRQTLGGNILEVTREKIGTGMKGYRTQMMDHALDRYLCESVFLQTKNRDIVTLAKKIVKNEKDPLVSARLIHDWVYRNIEKTPAITIPTAVDVLKTKKGDCNEHAVLFTAIARSAGIPAKIAIGLVYKDGFYYYHAWPEFYAGQWISADPTLGQFPADASHIRLITGELGEQGRILSVIGKIRIEVLAYR